MNHSIEEILKDALPQVTDLSPKQREVLYSALIQFSEKGFERTSTKDIATYAGVAEGTVYKKFKTKEELLFKGLIPLFRQCVLLVALREFKEELAHIETFESFVGTFIENRSTFIIQNRNMLKIMANEVATSEILQETIKGVLYKEVCEQFDPLLAHFQQTGEMQPIPTPHFIQIVMTQVFSLNMGYILGQSVDQKQYDTLKTFLKQNLYRMFALK
ncbi:TetR/AcrR family transcriptional regulator [Staphylococcus cornubiensis]|uniref:TetR/AcrR family transcriptional regulator n=1 Tax=Staphylococcus cornubiensis TaxID=1986155 RepID=UPI000A3CFCE3|nr:TetR/AcrR family transcriptional regulator [Staphylococcus cornubiensis]